MSDRHPSESVVFGQADMPARRLFDGVNASLAWGEKIMLSVVDFEPHGDVPNHSHPHEQAGICLEGEFELVVDGESRIVRAGEMYIIPGGTAHSARSTGGPCKTLDIFAPPREEYKE